MRFSPTWQGVALGYGEPWLVVAPALFWGDLLAVLSAGRAIYLMPAFMLLMVPGAFAGHLAGRAFAQRRDAWRFSIGLLLGASACASVLLWVSAHDLALGRRLVLALFGGPGLAGFWLWVGSLLGLGFAYLHRD